MMSKKRVKRVVALVLSVMFGFISTKTRIRRVNILI